MHKVEIEFACRYSCFGLFICSKWSFIMQPFRKQQFSAQGRQDAAADALQPKHLHTSHTGHVARGRLFFLFARCSKVLAGCNCDLLLNASRRCIRMGISRIGSVPAMLEELNPSLPLFLGIGYNRHLNHYSGGCISQTLQAAGQPSRYCTSGYLTLLSGIPTQN